MMKIRAGFELVYQCPGPVTMLMAINVHRSRLHDLLTPAEIRFSPGVQSRFYEDSFGNFCTLVRAPAGRLVISTDFVIADSGLPDRVNLGAIQHEIADLPNDVLSFLLGSRYCETDRLSNIAWSLFGHLPPGWPRVRAILDFTHKHIKFDYMQARNTRTAWEAYQEGVGVCRDYAHLALTFCRCMNIPARYCSGYMGDFGVPLVPPMDFSGWFEIYLGGEWYTCDARSNIPRIGRVLLAVGRDATDVAISNSFGVAELVGFTVVSDDVT
jgi:transglutaminase-like putative cysteine protease